VSVHRWLLSIPGAAAGSVHFASAGSPPLQSDTLSAVVRWLGATPMQVATFNMRSKVCDTQVRLRQANQAAAIRGFLSCWNVEWHETRRRAPWPISRVLLKFFQAPCENIRSQMQKKESKDEKAFDVGCRGNLLRSLFPYCSAGCGEGLRVLPQRHYLIHATVRLRHIGAVPGDVVRTRQRLLPESVARQRRRRVHLRAEFPQDVRLRTAPPEITRGAGSRDRDEHQWQSKRRKPAVSYDARRFATTLRKSVASSP